MGHLSYLTFRCQNLIDSVKNTYNKLVQFKVNSKKLEQNPKTLF